jgi:two-component system CheB/CheR fusion protein
VVDRVLSPEEIPDTLLELLASGTIAPSPPTAGALEETGVETILRLLRDAYGIDFGSYKPSTIVRRTQRRAELARIPSLERYAARLAADPAELDLVYKDLLIGVTRFFRDAGAFERLGRDVLPTVVREVRPGEEMRVWVAACATGEEAYSVAMVLREAMEAEGRTVPVKIFATDVHQDSLRTASLGIYDPPALVDVSAERRAKFFTRRDNRFQVTPELRAMVVFAPHNVLKDAPFTNLDLVTCRNLLIYFEPPAQRKVLGVFHFGLKRQGVLFLGPSETPGDLADELDVVDQHWKIFRKRRDVRLAPDVRLPGVGRYGRMRPGLPMAPLTPAVTDPTLLGAYDALLDELMPPCFLVGSRRELVHSFGGASRHLKVRDGRMTNDIADMLDGDLRVAVIGALQRVFVEHAPVVYRGMRLETAAGEHIVDVTARPIRNRRTGDVCALVTLTELAPSPEPRPTGEVFHVEQASRDHLVAIETELKYTRENLQATIEELETSNEELQATNEELVAANEELQSTNEELHSVNEELHTVNSELQRKITELIELNADMDHLQASTEVHTLFVDQRLCIRKFSPHIAATFNLLPHDVGRSIEVFTHTLDHSSLVQDIRRVAAGGPPFEGHLRDAAGRCYLVRILPYRRGTVVDGAVLTLIDVTALRAAEAESARMQMLLASIVHNSPNQIFIKDLDRRYVLADDTFRAMAGADPIGHVASEVFPAAVASALSAGEDDVLERGTVTETEVTLPGPEGPLTYLSVKFPLRDPAGVVSGVGGINTDVTGLKRAEREARDAVAGRDRFLATLSHELRNPLGAILHAASLLEREDLGEAAARWQRVVADGARHTARLLEDLLDVARVAQDKMTIDRAPLDLRDVVPAAVEAVAATVAAKRLTLTTKLGDTPIVVRGDAARLRQVVTNLLVNATRYTEPEGRVDVTLAREGSSAVLKVTDTGVGIAPEMLDRVFEPFVQAHAPGARARDGGIGVGLSVVRHVVSLHEGTVSAASAGPSRGSELVVRLPLTDELPPKASAAVPEAPAGLRVLLVEDDVHGREGLERLMKMDGVDVVAVGSGEEALEAFARRLPDAVLLDIGLPGIDGHEACRRLRAMPGGASVALIALTGFGQESDRAATRQAGFDEHVTKPIDVDDVYAVLARVKKQRA